MKTKYWPFILLIFLGSCNFNKTENALPYLGEQIVEDGKPKYHTIREFEYLDQDSNVINNKILSDCIYVADFFFTSCPSICPKVNRQMLKIYKEFENDDRVKLISFSLDPKRDNVERLKKYADNLNVSAPRWHFLTGDKDFTLDLAADFFVTALEDEDAPGGFDHSGKIILVDKGGHVRSFCEGTDPESIPGFVKDIKKLLASEF
mgnify:CR=1 FL=1